jgi:hypothetical protein
MPDSAQHLSDELMLRFIDNELPAKEVDRVHEHMSVCPACRDRQSAIESTSDALLGLYRSELPKADSYGMESRVRLKARLLRSRQAFFRRRSLADALSFRVVLSTALVGVFTVLIFADVQVWKSSHVITTAKTGLLVPNHSLTPGAVRSITLAEVCSANDSDLDPEISSSLAKTVLDEYGVRSEKHSRDYQIDYLVNPQLGGTSDIRNLWPEPYSNGKWNAHAKDDLERRLHQMVCNGTVDLAVAQREIETDWIAAYKRYIGNERS